MLDEPYRSAEQLVKWLTVLLVAYAVFCLLAAWGGRLQLELNKTFAEREAEWEPSGGEPTQSWVDAYIIPGEMILGSLGQSVVGIALIVLFCLWIPQANRNARALGATGMRFTPRWCVIWYLIPIMHLFRPYEAMKEIWRASTPADGTQWRQHRVPLILPLWWALWLASLLAYCVAHGWPWEGYRGSWRATGATIFADAIDVPLAIVAMLLVRNIHRTQEHSRTTTVFD